MIENIKDVNRFVALDFEKLSYSGTSICQIGLAVIEDNKIVETFESLVCPPTKQEDYFPCSVHEIRYKTVKNEKKFPEVWEKVDKIIGDSPIVIHNVGCERSCLRACNELFGTNKKYSYIDTQRIYEVKNPNYKKRSLAFLTKKYNIELEQNHNALQDAKACANLFILFKKIYNLAEDKTYPWIYQE